MHSPNISNKRLIIPGPADPEDSTSVARSSWSYTNWNRPVLHWKKLRSHERQGEEPDPQDKMESYLSNLKSAILTDITMPTRGIKQVCLALSIILLVAGRAIAQTDSTVSMSPGSDRALTVFSTISHDGVAALRTMGHVLAAPMRWDGRDLLIAGGIVGVAAVCYSLDNRMYNLMERNHSAVNDHATSVAAEYGSGYFAIGIPAALYLSGILFKDEWVRETAVIVGSTVLLAGAITTVGKIVIGRARPYTGFGRHTFRPFKAKEDFMSFPSGHTTAAFALSASLATRIRNVWASVGLYGLAIAASTSRMYTRDHWLSDVVFSAAYTTAVAHSVVKRFENERPEGEDEHSLQIVPTENGVSVVWLF